MITATSVLGKRWIVNSTGYRTVMSYNSSGSEYNVRIPHFSNPNVSYEGVATGNAGSEDNAKVLTLSAPYAANFHSCRTGNCSPPFLI